MPIRSPIAERFCRCVDDSAWTILFQGDTSLRNVYHVYAVNPAKHPRVKHDAARSFINFLVSRPIQRAIAAFKRDEYGESLFFPMPFRDNGTLDAPTSSEGSHRQGLSRTDEDRDRTDLDQRSAWLRVLEVLAILLILAEHLEDVLIGDERVRDLDRECLGYVSGSSKVISTSRWPKSVRRNRSVTRSASLCG